MSKVYHGENKQLSGETEHLTERSDVYTGVMKEGRGESLGRGKMNTVTLTSFKGLVCLSNYEDMCCLECRIMAHKCEIRAKDVN